MTTFIEICEVLSYAVLIFMFIVLVGYWTGANYYFKLNAALIQALVVSNAIGWFFWLICQGLGALTHTRTPEEVHNLSFGIVGIINIGIIGLYVVFNLFIWFEQSRKYFWSKRGL